MGKHGTALERLAEVDTVVFDKTGTLTLGMPEPVALTDHPQAAVAVAAALAAGSSHPLARALAEGVRAANVTRAVVTDVREVPGHGIEGLWQGARVRLGRADWCGAEPIAATATYLSLEGQTHAFAFTDRPRPGADKAVAALRAAGMKIELLSGDSPAPVQALAERLGIADWRAGVLPAEKAARVAELSAAGHKVLMVGDGLNDTAALAMSSFAVSQNALRLK